MLDARLPRSHRETFAPEGAKVERDLTFLRELVVRPWILGREHADDAQRAARPHGFHEVVHRLIRDFMASRIMCLVADTLAALVSAGAMRHLED